LVDRPIFRITSRAVTPKFSPLYIPKIIDLGLGCHLPVWALGDFDTHLRFVLQQR